MKKGQTNGTPLPVQARERLRLLVVERGLREAAEILRSGQQSIVRALSGLGLRVGTNTALCLALAQLDAASDQPRTATG